MGDHLLAAIVNGAKFSEKVADGHHLVAMGARSAGSKPFAKDAALVATLLTQQACLTHGALVDDGRLWETASKAVYFGETGRLFRHCGINVVSVLPTRAALVESRGD